MRSGALAALTAGLLMAGLAGGAAAQSESPAATGGLDNTDWLLGSVGTTPVPSGTNANLIFVSGEAGGFAGCNQFAASYTTDGSSTLTFTNIATTRKSCSKATDAFEAGYTAALGTVASYKLASGTLDLADASGATVLSYGATAPATVEGPWIVTQYINGKGGMESVSADFAPTVAFAPDGGVEGFDGCNDFSGGYSVDGSGIAIGPLMGTLKSCGDTIDAQASAFLTALQLSRGWRFGAGALQLRNGPHLVVEANSAIGH